MAFALVLIAGCGGSGGSSGMASGATESRAASTGGAGGGGSEGGEGGGGQAESGEAAEEEPGSSGEGSISKAEFVKEANGICSRVSTESLVEANAYLKKKQQHGGSESEEQILAQAIHAVLLPKFEEQIEQIRSLGMPVGDEEKVEAFLEASEEGIEVSRKKRYTPANLPRFGEEFSKARQLGQSYGLSKCIFYE